MQQKLTYWGTGPVLGLGTTVCFLAMLAIDHAASPAWRINWLPIPIAWTLGLAMLLAGVVLYLRVARTLLASLRDQQLLTTGAYGVVRHPLYAIALWLLCPGFCILWRSWLIMTTPIFMSLLVLWATRREEKSLAAAFGPAYDAYRQQTPALLPRWKKSSFDP